MSTPPEEPTRHLPPAQAPPPRVREREYLGPDDGGGLLAELQDQVRSLRTAVVLLGLLSVVALGIAAWALLKSHDDTTTTTTQPGGASAARVSRLQDRVSNLETKVGNRATTGGLNDLKTQQKDLADRVDKLESKSGQTQNAASKDTVDQVSQDVQDLQKRVENLEKQQANPSPTP
jgi:outer membrane murein-binding lipoprotein Lpp